jgi:hypothetical protein
MQKLIDPDPSDGVTIDGNKLAECSFFGRGL